jgi:hypothetical protein
MPENDVQIAKQKQYNLITFKTLLFSHIRARTKPMHRSPPILTLKAHFATKTIIQARCVEITRRLTRRLIVIKAVTTSCKQKRSFRSIQIFCLTSSKVIASINAGRCSPDIVGDLRIFSGG